MIAYPFFTHDMATDKGTHRWIRLLQVVLAMELSVNPMPVSSPDHILMNAFEELHGEMKRWIGFDDAENRWRQARTTESDMNESLHLRWMDIGARDIIYSLLDQGASVQDTIRDLFILFVNRRLKNCRWKVCDKVCRTWNARSAEQKGAFLAMVDLSEQNMFRKLADADKWWPESPQNRQSNEYYDALDRSSAPQRYGQLGMTIEQFTKAAFATRHELEHLGTLAEYEDYSNDAENWCDAVTSPDQLVDANCPICLEKFEFPRKRGRQPKRLPLKARCEHIICQACFTKWTTGDSQNADKCVLCRTRFWDMPAHAEHWQPLSNTMLDVYQYPDTAASGIEDKLQPYLSALRETLDYKPPLPLYQDDFATLSKDLLGPTKAVVDWYHETQPYDRLDYAQATVDYIAASGERLKAFHKNDVEGYRRAVKKQFCKLVLRTIIRFSIELDHWQRYLAAEERMVNTWAWLRDRPVECQEGEITDVFALESYNQFGRETD